MPYAKAMTWRLGILFGMLAARGDEMRENSEYSSLTPGVMGVCVVVKAVKGDR